MTPPSPLLLRIPVSLLLLLMLVGCGSEAPLNSAPSELPDVSAFALLADEEDDDQGEEGPFPGVSHGDDRVVLTATGNLETLLHYLPVDVQEHLPDIDTYVVRSRYGTSAAPLAGLLRTFGFTDAQPDVSLEDAESQGMSVSFDEGMSISFDDGMSWSFDEGMSVSFDDGMSVSFDDGMSVSFDDGRIGSGAEDQEFLHRMNVSAAHDLARGAGVRVALLDTGVDPTHPGLYHRITRGWDYIDQDDDPAETRDGIDSDGDGMVDEAFGHGTHLAGLIALAAPDAEILVYRVLDDDGRGVGSRVAQAIVHATNAGAQVINLSLGMTEDFRSVEKALQFAQARGVVVITSAGNQGVELQQYPAAYPEAAAVGSVDHLDQPSLFSNRGDAVWVVAPGEGLRSTLPGGYGTGSGTSMSAALVSGLAALIIERHPDLDAVQVRDRLAAGTVPETALPGQTGFGRVDFLAAVQ